jgi:pathogenesis-related protein 1
MLTSHRWRALGAVSVLGVVVGCNSILGYSDVRIVDEPSEPSTTDRPVTDEDAGSVSASSSGSGPSSASASSSSSSSSSSGGSGSSSSSSSSSGSTSSSGNLGAGEPPELAGITAAHNRARAAENAGLPPMTWDPEIARVAATWAATCTPSDQVPGLPAHNPNPSTAKYGRLGENIAGSPDVAQCMDLWMNEKQFYNHTTGVCSGQTCGHYTQIVWRTATKLGCAVSNCPNLRFGNSIICNFSTGQSGGKPY